MTQPPTVSPATPRPALTLTFALAFGLAAGCAGTEPERIPTYPLTDARQAIETMRARSAGLESISGEGTITFTDTRDQSVRLDAAFAFGPPDRARVRAWKFGQAVLDLTVTPDGTWLYLPQRDDGRAGSLRAGSERTGEALRQWLRLVSGEIDSPGGTVRVAGPKLVVTRPTPEGLMLACEIDRATLTARRCALTDAAGRERFSLVLGSYRSVGPTVWPARLEARSDEGRVLIEARDPQLNAAPPTAFRPPARGVKLR